MTEDMETSSTGANTDDRTVAISRETAETTINVTLAVDGDGEAAIDTGIGFLIICLKRLRNTDCLI